MQPLSDEAPLALFDSVFTETAVASGDLTLAVRTWGDPSRTPVVLVHGYPDTSSVWQDVAPRLARQHYVIAYDVRGAGLSSAPARTADYRLAKLTDDFIAVIDALCPGRPVHLIAHDWGSIQGWEFVTEPRLAGRIASYTSCSGPCLDHVGHWLRERLLRPTPASLGKLAGQLARSWYVYLFHLPLIPELGWRLWLGRAWPRLLRRIEKTPVAPRATQADDGARGVRLYRANFIRCLFTPRERYAHAPVQTIVPLGDKYVSPALSEDLSRWVPQYYRREVAAGHWLPLADPARFAGLAQQLIDAVESGDEPPALANARRRATSGRFSGKVAVVTGAGSGIGRCAALAFAREGATVVAVDIDLASAERTALLLRLIGAAAHARRVDVGAADEMAALAGWVGRELGGADVVINNAGIGMAGGILDTSAAHWERILHVNLWGVIHGSRLFAQQMAARGTGGHIVNTASAAAFGPSRDLPAYATTKAAVLMLSECMRAELAEQGIGVTAVCPGFAETGIMASTQYAGANAQDEARLRKRATKLYQMRGLKPDTVAQAMVDAVLRNRPVVAVGTEAHALRFVGRFMPWLGRIIARVSMASH
ncbi:short-chain dehydrogenase [Burkholderia stagnalis]|uniref:SDR family oxidoreductase n=1 Tax=Burkholderia stagnalis TaxID=1503054 RepID=A0A6L3N515_9BURK|nr:SDR family oxidoreductase [Burkholderia stagnalis]KAB0640433.1 SDR family oxidoreductase [Burkholderia stagnalis]KVM90337.1 short-chain dehydrogenase [Burkholderia stagnalis]KVO39423.1 short-chain dehydrogenase [Burkholderia stagnalis]KVO74665.1 short-chain dehydrogenase [Burkholderia stagnalis]KVW57609.1 short-chain dehydrogenase [Burkholderia stagnalis]